MEATNYITLGEAKQHLNVDLDYTGDDTLIIGYLNSALEIVLSESCCELVDVVNARGRLNGIAKSAVLLKLGDLYAFREGNYTGAINQVNGGYDRLISLIRKYK